MVVGEAEAIKHVGRELGDSLKQLNHPQIIPVFVGIALGVIARKLAASIFPACPAPVKLGLAGGPLIVAIMLSRLGNIGPLVWYMPISANFMLRELGIVLFLAVRRAQAAATSSSHTLPAATGCVWMGSARSSRSCRCWSSACSPRLVYKLNYLTLCGLLAGSMTDPPALAFAGDDHRLRRARRSPTRRSTRW